MPIWDRIFRKEIESNIAASVPLVNDLTSVQYPEDNYANFASQGYARSTIVNACIKEIATGVATARFYVQRDSEDGIVEVENSPLANLLKYPNANQDFYTWLERLVTYLYVSGNAYVLKERARTNQVVAMYLLRPDRVSIMPDGQGIKGYSYEIDGKEYFLAPEDVGHISFPNPANDSYGLSPLHVLSKTINLDMSMTDFAKVYFQNAGVPSGLLKVKRRLTSQEEANRIRSRWRSSFGGTNNFHKVAVLDDDAEYQQMASAPSDMALVDLHNHTESRICAVLGVPPILISANVGLARSTFANYREARFSFHSETLEPLINRIVRFFNYCLGYEMDETVAVDLTEMRSFLDDKESINARASSLFQSGIITLNEARELVGQDALPDGEVRRLPSNILESGTPSEVQAFPSGFQSMLSEKRKEPVTPRGLQMGSNLNRNRDELAEKWTPTVEAFFKRLKSRVDGIIGRHLSRDTEIEKAGGFPFTASTLVPDSEIGNLSEIFYRMFVEVSRETYGIINSSGVAGEATWSEAAPAISSLLTEAPARATIVHNTTRKNVQKVLTQALQRGYSIDQLARGVPNDDFVGIRSLLNETATRSKMIARTEIMRSQNITSVNLFKDQGFDYVRAYDVDGDPHDTYVPAGDPYGRTCIERDGQVYRVDDARNIMDHPNGTLSWVPMPRSYQPEGVTA
jgi:HK97 family phage portal protein